MSLHAGHLSLRVTPGIPADPIYRLSVTQYHDLIDRGILTSDDPVELLEGWLVLKMTKKPPHSVATRRTRLALEKVVSPGYFVDSQEPVTTGDSEPEPDVCIVRANAGDYTAQHPGASDVPLIVEVADTTLPTDRVTKKRVYARAGFPVYWIVNLVNSVVEVYTIPTGPAEEPTYAGRDEYRLGDAIPVAIDGIESGKIPAADILPS